MKILFVSYNSNPSFDDPWLWLERIRAYTGVPEALAKYHTVISIEQINYTGELESNGVQYYFFNYKKTRKLFPIRLHRFIKKLNPDIVIVHGTHFPLQVIHLKIVLRSANILVQNHAEKLHNTPKRYLQKLADKCIDAYLFTSEAMAKPWLENKIISHKKKIWSIMEGSSFFSPSDKNEAICKTGVNGFPAFLFVGRLNDNKDPLMIVRSFLRYNKLQPSARLYMIYQTTELLETMKNIIAVSDNGHAIILVGKISNDLMQYWYSSVDFIISASHYEGSGIAVCEAMSCGCIPLLTAIESFKKMSGNGACGILYNIHKENGLFNALVKTQYLTIEEEKKKVLQQFQTDLSFEAIAKQIAEKINAL